MDEAAIGRLVLTNRKPAARGFALDRWTFIRFAPATKTSTTIPLSDFRLLLKIM
jgi:hypothetical protein